MAHFKAKLKAVVIKYLLISDYFDYEMHQINVILIPTLA
jgi:hypothetical protein